MELIRGWIMTVTVSAMVIAVAEILMPEGSVKTVGKLTGGLVLLLGILQPILRMDYTEMMVQLEDVTSHSVAIGETQEFAQNNWHKGIIELELSAYVLDKAQGLGYPCQVRITCEIGENQVPYPVRGEIAGLSAEQQEVMAALLEADLGLSREEQSYYASDTLP